MQSLYRAYIKFWNIKISQSVGTVTGLCMYRIVVVVLHRAKALC